MAKTFKDFSIHIFRNELGEYHLYAECQLVGESSLIRLSNERVEQFVGIGQSLRAGTLIRDQVPVAGQFLFSSVFVSEIRDMFLRARSVAHATETGLRIVFKFGESQELQEVPWEILHDGKKFLALQPTTPVVRYFRQDEPLAAHPFPPPLRVLFTTACPEGYTPLDLGNEEHQLRQGLSGHGDQIELMVERNISLDRLNHILLRAQNTDHPFHVWHHAGHGGLHKSHGFELALEERGKYQPATTSQLSSILGSCPDTQMAILNVCHGGAPNGLANYLAALNIPIVIGFQASVLDRHALLLARELYSTMLTATIEQAIAQVRNELAVDDQKTGRTAWTLPIMFARTQQAVELVRSPSISASPVNPSPKGIHFNIGKNAVNAKTSNIVGTLNDGSDSPMNDDVFVEFNLDEGAVNSDISNLIGQINTNDARHVLEMLTGRNANSDEGNQ